MLLLRRILQRKAAVTDVTVDDEYVLFIKDIIKNRDRFIDGIYTSCTKKYEISYRHVLKDYNIELKTPIRIGSISKRIEVSRVKTREYTDDFFFYMLIWSYFMLKENNEYMAADTKAVKFCLSSGITPHTILKVLDVFKDNPISLNVDRSENIIETINSEYKHAYLK